MVDTMDDVTDLTPEEIQSLERLNLCRRSTKPGWITISGAFFNAPSPSTENSLSTSTITASVRIQNFNTNNLRRYDIPIVADSAEGLEFIGFVPETANEIFQRYHTRPDPNRNPDSLLDYVRGHVLMLKLPRLGDLTPREAMTKIGLKLQIQDALMDPHFTNLLWTETLLYWIRDTIRINYETLLQLQQRIKNHAHNGSHKNKGTGFEGSFSGLEEPPAQMASLQPQVDLTVNMTPRDYNLPANHIALGSEGPLLPEHLVLYKGKASAERLNDPWFENDGTLNMAAIATCLGGDFNRSRTAWYWTSEKEVAEEYRKWAARRCPWSETWLIRIQIPNDFIDSLKRNELWYGQDWKEYMWHRKRLTAPPAKFDYLWRETSSDVICGHIYTGTDNMITRIKKEDVQTRITSDNLLRNTTTGRIAIQYVFIEEDSVMRMGELIRGKIHIDITGAYAPQDAYS